MKSCHRLLTALPFILSLVISVSAQSFPEAHDVSKTWIDTLPDGKIIEYRNDGSTVEYHLPDSSLRAVTAPTKSIPEKILTSKDEGVAYTWALGGTLVPLIWAKSLVQEGHPMAGEIIPLAIVGLVGPSLGQFYAGSASQAMSGIGFRAVGLSVFAFGVEQLANSMFSEEGAGGGGLIAGGIVCYTIGTLYSLIDTHDAVKRANEKATAQHFGFAPELFPSSSGGLKPGAVAWVRF